MYKINDEVFYMKIDEQVEYLIQLINEIDEEYKNTTTAFNTRITAIEEKCKEFDEVFTQVNEKISTLEATEKAHYEEVLASIAEQATTFQGKIDSLKSELEQEIALKQNINDDTLKTESKKIVGAINENKDTIDNNKTELENKIDTTKTELENKITVKQDMTDDSLKTSIKTIVGAINEIFDKESTGVAIDEKTITLTDTNAIQVNPEILTNDRLTVAVEPLSADNPYNDQNFNKIFTLGVSYTTDPINEGIGQLKNVYFRVVNKGTKNYAALENEGYPAYNAIIGMAQYGAEPDKLSSYLFANTREPGKTPETSYITSAQAVNIENGTTYTTPFLPFKLIKELFTPIGYVMASTQATVPVYWGTWQQIGYVTVNSVKVYYYKRTA